jgi:hypothetical protein
LTDCEISDNSVSSNGTGGVGGVLSQQSTTMSRCKVKNNFGEIAGIGASGTCTISDSDISFNVPPDVNGEQPAAIGCDQLTMTNCLVSHNGGVGKAGCGGIQGKSISLYNCQINNNVGLFAGAIRIFSAGSGLMTLAICVVSGNSAGGVGGLFGNFSLTNCIVTNNIGGDCGGVRGGGQIDSCTIAGNTGANAGGTMFDTVNPSVVRNSTIVNNKSNYGAGLRISSGDLTIQNCTIANNSATSSGGGIYNNSAPNSISLVDTIVAGNLAAGMPSDLLNSHTGLSYQHCAIESANGLTAATNLGGNLPFGADLKLGPLANYGGPTQTIPLLADCPCINAGVPISGITTDQRRYARTYGSAPDIGAYELQPPRVNSVVINDGSAQRSRVTSVTVNFDSLVAVTPGAFRLQRQSDGQLVNLFPEYFIGGPTTSVSLSFSGALTEFGSLKDGRYTLTVFGTRVSNFVGSLDGNGDSVPGDDYVLASSGTAGIFRLFGDANGDGYVGASDFILFRMNFGGNADTFDFDGDGSVSANDFVQFRLRFGGSI